ncbi:MAG: alpha/beta hydrolase [Mycobacterium sp.]
MSGWEPDVLPGYWQTTFALGPDPDGEGELEATLVRRGAPDTSVGRAVLMVHGFTDYFFNTELADCFAARGIAPYALDLHKCGRSHREGQTPHFTTNLARYDAELERALDTIAAECDAPVLIYGHSAGGLVVSLWLDRRRRAATPEKGVSGLVLNSPWLDLHGHPILRMPPATAAIMALGRLRKRTVVRRPTEGGYGITLHRDYHGEFDYDLTWKPIGGFPVTFGWIHAIRRGQARLHRGLDVGVPNLVLRSDRSVREVGDAPEDIAGVEGIGAIEMMRRGDAVLDVKQIARWAGCIGNRTTIAPITEAKHDVFLSVPDSRAQAYAELHSWLDWYLTSHLADTSAKPTQTDESEGHG